MPLNEEEWGLVREWIRDYLLNDPHPHLVLERYDFSPDFIGSLALGAVPEENARSLIHASRRSIEEQMKLVEVLVSLLSPLPAVEKAKNFLKRLLADWELRVKIRGKERDMFQMSVFGDEVFIGRSELRETLRRFLSGSDKFVLLVDGVANSGRSYTYTFLRHLGQQSGFRPARVTLSPTSTADKVVRRLAGYTDDPTGRLPPLNLAELNDLLPSLDDAAHWVVRRAAALDQPLWLVLDECDMLERSSDVWDLIGELGLAIYEQVCGDRSPRLVLLGYGPTMHQLPDDLRVNQCQDTARVVDPRDLHGFFDQYFHESPPAWLGEGPAAEEQITELVRLAVDEVLRFANAPGGEESYMRRICRAAEGAVRVYQSL
ncbi:hypothetical protein [Streptomyces natalensis]|uniref:hypothetical protein n=1 Tax=Streptomyces natalensis TaxID=68242 RepID=UPI0006909611|nr:hypothetical protein [Streptomyces natalensis]